MTDGTESSSSAIRSPHKEPEVTITPPATCTNPDCLFDQITLLCEQREISRKNEIEDFLYRNGNSSGLKKDTLDSRRLHLLRSFSQESDSSLNNYDFESTSFDAEEFLEDLGFAGPSDPTIPDRFMPSLIRRISSLPDIAKKNLDQRVWQSIGCFKRKEGKKRLFRNRSFDREEYSCCSSPLSSTGSPASGLTIHCYKKNGDFPLIRSQTGPAAFSEEKCKFPGAANGSEDKNTDKVSGVSCSKIAKQESYSSSNQSSNSKDEDETEHRKVAPEGRVSELIVNVTDISEEDNISRTPKETQSAESSPAECPSETGDIHQVSGVKANFEIPFEFQSKTEVFDTAAVSLELVSETGGFNDDFGYGTDAHSKHDEIKTNAGKETVAQTQKLDFGQCAEGNETDAITFSVDSCDSKVEKSKTSPLDDGGVSSKETREETNEGLKMCRSDYIGQQKKQTSEKIFISVAEPQFLEEMLCPISCVSDSSSTRRNDKQVTDTKRAESLTDLNLGRKQSTRKVPTEILAPPNVEQNLHSFNVDSESLASSCTGKNSNDCNINTNFADISKCRFPPKKTPVQRKISTSPAQPPLLEKMRHHSTGSLSALDHCNATREKDKHNVTVFNPSTEKSIKFQKNVLSRKKSVSTSPLPKVPFLSSDFESYSSSGKIIKLLERINSELKSECARSVTTDLSPQQTQLDRKRSSSTTFLSTFEETEDDPNPRSVVKSRTDEVCEQEMSKDDDFQKSNFHRMRKNIFRKQSTLNSPSEDSNSPSSNDSPLSSPLGVKQEPNGVDEELNRKRANSDMLDLQRNQSYPEKVPLLPFSPSKSERDRIKDHSKRSPDLNDSNIKTETPLKSISFLKKANVARSSPKLEAKFLSSKTESPRLFARRIRSTDGSDRELSPILRPLPPTLLTSDSSYSSSDFSPGWKRKIPSAESEVSNSVDVSGEEFKSESETTTSGFRIYSSLSGNSEENSDADDSKSGSLAGRVAPIPAVPRRDITAKMCECGQIGMNFNLDDSDSNIKVQLHSPKRTANASEADEILCVVMPPAQTFESKSLAEKESPDNDATRVVGAADDAATSNGRLQGQSKTSPIKETGSQTSAANTARVSERFKIISHPFRRLNTKLKTEDLFVKQTDTPPKLKYCNKSLSLGNIDTPKTDFFKSLILDSCDENGQERSSPRLSPFQKRKQLSLDQKQHPGPKVTDLLERFESFRADSEGSDLSSRRSLKRKQHLLEGDKSSSVSATQCVRRSPRGLLTVKATDNDSRAGNWIDSIESSDSLSPMPNTNDAHNNYDNDDEDKESDSTSVNIVRYGDTLRSHDDNGQLLPCRSVSDSNSDMLNLSTISTHTSDRLQTPASIKEILRTTGFSKEAAETWTSPVAMKDESPGNTSGNGSETFVNGVYLMVNSDDSENELGLNPDLHYSSVYLEINVDQLASAAARYGIQEEERSSKKLQKRENVSSSADYTSQSESMRRERLVLQNPSQRASKDLEELQEAIQKAKETRVSASRELFLLQELLRKGSDDIQNNPTTSSQDSTNGSSSQDLINSSCREEDSECSSINRIELHGHQVGSATQGLSERCKEGTSNSDAIYGVDSETESYNRPLPLSQKSLEDIASLEKELEALREELKGSAKREFDATERIDALKSALMDLQAEKSRIQEALSDLQQKTKKEASSSESLLNEEEVYRIKEQVRQEWQERFSEIKQKLSKREVELNAIKEENTKLKEQVELSRLEDVSCQCRSKVKNHNFIHVNGISIENGTTTQPGVKSSSPIKSIRQDCDRLQKSLMEAEQKADHLNLLLNQKLIELNKLQLTLSKQTKDMIQLERAYFQLRCHLTKGSNKSGGICISPSSRISLLHQIPSCDRTLSPLSLVKQDAPP